MRKILLPIILLLLLVTLTSCCRDSYSFKEPIDEIESIEIVSAENSLEFTVVKILSEEERKDFLEQFQAMEFSKYLGDPTDLYGDAIKITYQSGIYEMICPFGAEYVEDGIIQYRWRRCDEDEFNKLLNNFLT